MAASATPLLRPTIYIEESEFRHCAKNSLTDPYPIRVTPPPDRVKGTINNKTLAINRDYCIPHDPPCIEGNLFNDKLPILKRLAIDDTFHDLSQTRTGYNCKGFNEDGPLAYLLTGYFVKADKDFFPTCKELINLPIFQTLKGYTRFEPKVAASIELTYGLQPADVSITYYDIIDGFNVGGDNKIIESLYKKVKFAGSSIRIIKPDDAAIQAAKGFAVKKEAAKIKGAKALKAAPAPQVVSGAKAASGQKAPKAKGSAPPGSPVGNDDDNGAGGDTDFIGIINAKAGGNAAALNACLKQIADFVRWFMYSNDINKALTQDRLIINAYPIEIPTTSIKILSDAGIGFMGKFFSVPYSNATPFIAVPCFLDSAATSISQFDPTLDIVYETILRSPAQVTAQAAPVEALAKIMEVEAPLEPCRLVPIVSNYFSCNEFFMCYIFNEGTTSYGAESLYNFSLAIVPIVPNPTRETDVGDTLPNIDMIFEIRNVASLPINIHACNKLLKWIDENPELVARYYFGETRKIKVKDDNTPCGTSGAGVSYIGKVLAKMTGLIDSTNKSAFFPATGITTTSKQFVNLKNYLNELKGIGNLNQRIPISDARILKIFCAKTAVHGSTNVIANITEDDFKKLYRILADYKRTGDYQQSYTVLKAILAEGKNTEQYTFNSVDELSTLVGRLLRIPSINYVNNGAECKLYRCDIYNADSVDLETRMKENNIKLIQNYLSKIRNKIALTKNFCDNYYSYICALITQLKSIIKNIKTQVALPLQTIDKFSYITAIMRCSSTIYALKSIIQQCNKFLEQEQEQVSDTEPSVTISPLEGRYHPESIPLSDISYLRTMEDLKTVGTYEKDNFGLYDLISEKYPEVINLSELTLNPGIATYFQLPTISQVLYRIDKFGLHIKDFKDNSFDFKALKNYFDKVLELKKKLNSGRGGRQVEVYQKDLLIKENFFVTEYNKFISQLPSDVFSSFTIANFDDIFVFDPTTKTGTMLIQPSYLVKNPNFTLLEVKSDNSDAEAITKDASAADEITKAANEITKDADDIQDKLNSDKTNIDIDEAIELTGIQSLLAAAKAKAEADRATAEALRAEAEADRETAEAEAKAKALRADAEAKAKAEAAEALVQLSSQSSINIFFANIDKIIETNCPQPTNEEAHAAAVMEVSESIEGGEESNDMETADIDLSGEAIEDQVGGAGISTPQEYNCFCLRSEIKDLVLKLFNKCNTYMQNINKQEYIIDPSTQTTLEASYSTNLTAYLQKASELFETDDFCYKVLFEQPEEYDIYSENLGIVIGLKLLATQFTYGDILNYDATKISNWNNRLHVRLGRYAAKALGLYHYKDRTVTVADMITILDIPYVKHILYYLAWAKADYVMLVCDLIEDVDINGNSICSDGDSGLADASYLTASGTPSGPNPPDIYDGNNPYADTIKMTEPDCRFSFCRKNWQIVSRTVKALGISSIYSILGFAQCHFLYYYESEGNTCFNPRFCDFSDEISGLLRATNNNLRTDSAQRFLSYDLNILVRQLWLTVNYNKIPVRATDISANMYNCVGWPNWDKEGSLLRSTSESAPLLHTDSSNVEDTKPALHDMNIDALEQIDIQAEARAEAEEAEAEERKRKLSQGSSSDSDSDSNSDPPPTKVFKPDTNESKGGRRMKTRKNPKKIKKPKKTKRRYSTIANKRTRRNK